MFLRDLDANIPLLRSGAVLTNRFYKHFAPTELDVRTNRSTQSLLRATTDHKFFTTQSDIIVYQCLTCAGLLRPCFWVG